VSDLAAEKTAARKAALARRKAAFDAAGPDASARLSSVVAGHRGVPLSGFMAIRTEIDPRPVMEEAAAHGPVCVPVIQGRGLPLRFSRWEPGMTMREGPFGAMIPVVDDFIEPEILIVPLMAFTREGGRLGYGAIGVAFTAQDAVTLALAPTDQPLDMVVTEQEIIAISR